MNIPMVFDPVEFSKILWPDNHFYSKQRDMIYSARDAVETDVVACNGSGKDHTTGFIALSFFIAPWLYFGREHMLQVHRETPESAPLRLRHTRRGVTTSVSAEHLRVLWAEIGKWMETADEKYPLFADRGGPLVLNDLELRFKDELHLKKPPNYLIGMVAEKPEKFSGHHARYTMAIGDEASGLPDACEERFPPWAKRRYYFGNAEVCANKFFRAHFEAGNVGSKPGMNTKYLRQCIRITADDSPNVQRAKEQIGRGEEPDGRNVVVGVVSWNDYQERRTMLDPIRQSVVLDARWYDGPELKLIPRGWIDDATEYAKSRPSISGTKWLGVDPAEGGDDTSWVLIDQHGVLLINSVKTQDTNVVFGRTLDLMRSNGVLPENVLFDRGGGKTHADRLRAMGYNVRTVDFGSIKAEPKRGIRIFPEKREIVETKGEFQHRRSEMYWNIRELLEVPLSVSDDAALDEAIRAAKTHVLPPRKRFALPLPMCEELIRQLAVVPLKYDELGRFKLIPKQNPHDPEDVETFRYLLGRSPDQADAFALAIFGMMNKPIQARAGA